MLSQVVVSRALAQLVRRGFVTRQRTRQDQRSLEVTLTRQGWRYYDSLVPLMRQQEQVLRAVIGAPELERLFSVLDRFDAFFAALEERRRLNGDIAKVDTVSVRPGNGANGQQRKNAGRSSGRH